MSGPPTKKRRTATSVNPNGAASNTTALPSPKPPKTKRITIHSHPPRPRRHLPAPPPSPPAPSSAADSPTPHDPATAGETSAAHLRALHATLTQLSGLLARNRNQHRSQLWFKHVAILARWLRKLVRLEEEIWGLLYGDGMRSGEAGMGRMAEEVRRRFEREEELVKRREVVMWWVRERVVPMAWVAGSGVLGDGQFAGVGLVFVGLVGDVRGLVGGVRERERERARGRDGDGEGVVVGRSVGKVQGRGMGRRRDSGGEVRDTAVGENEEMGGVGVGENEDVGEVVQRQDTCGRDELPLSGLRKKTMDDDKSALFDEPADPDITMESPPDQPIPAASSPFASFDDVDDNDVDHDTHNHHRPSEASSPAAKSKPTPAQLRLQAGPKADPLRPGEPNETSAGTATSNRPKRVQRDEGRIEGSTGKESRRGDGGKKKTLAKKEKEKEKENESSADNVENNKKGGEKSDDDKPREKSRAKSRTGTKSESKSKSKPKGNEKENGKAKGKGNAIDDLFAGFG